MAATTNTNMIHTVLGSGGKRMQEITNAAQKTTVDLNDFNRGLYMYHLLDATGKVISITNQSNVAASASASTVVLVNTAVTNIVMDPTASNQFTYTSNGIRVMNVKYSFDLTTTINSVVTTRKVTVTESFTYDDVQAFY